jgi:hypothetical protein
MVNGSNGEAAVGPDLAVPVARSPQIRAKSEDNATVKLRLVRSLPVRQAQLRNRINDLR